MTDSNLTISIPIAILELLKKVRDPEITALTAVDMGIIRKVVQEDKDLVITMTPTYSGCPAMDTIESDIKRVLTNEGYTVTVHTSLTPPWTTDWMTDEAKEKLRKFGIAPPSGSASKKALMGEEEDVISCPHCESKDTVIISQFGSTACKALYKCNTCLQPFDYFKCI